jgi:hypothetical protein
MACPFAKGFGKKRGRKEDIRISEKQRLTASAALHGYTVTPGFEQQLTDL